MIEPARRHADYSDVVASPPDKDARIRAVPFDAIELELGLLWADVEPPANDA